MDEVKEDEQWKTSGNCDKCRRANFCNKKCSKRKKREEHMLASVIDAAMYKVMGRFYR